MKVYINLFSFVKASEFKEKGVGANVAFQESVWKENDKFFFERGGSSYPVKSKNGLVVHKYMIIPIDDELIEKLK